ncbi:MAG: porphobilinogen deaminase [Candidatus Mesenet longicola]|uniref:Porphobilinogen deaminase n=1 Tax=Candidatus Mesenet longicola TaxID=1892558 RepID=A0A8J3HRU4_9RICK|nr:MAG: porphobilinogen deaminase [Candidatus Mesenet longicola]GHM59138.1 MAG: porphobilinogen deaminase [Candidatus Mesenet longicola]
MLIKIGTRGSELAVIQAMEAKELLLSYFPNLDIEIVTIKTSGDKNTNIALSSIGGKGLFTLEIENALLSKNIDIAVHSLKDVPAFFAQGLIIPCVLKRYSPYDAFISHKYQNILSLPYDATVATSAIRRKVQLQKLRPDLNIVPIRGNVTTRLKKLELFDGMILAEAGLIRLQKHNVIKKVLPAKEMLPSVGQGAICLQCSAGNTKVIEMLEAINHKATFTQIQAERSFMRTINGSCFTPLAALAEYQSENQLYLRCMLADEQGKNVYFTERLAHVEDAEKMGIDAGLELKAKIY